ncbi:DUF1254 domain-containing protein [Candidatus Colwellia aromaticivorans]|nr:DUF1254 domain-containing protein [Candidatus Colwellia aromaticivorans]
MAEVGNPFNERNGWNSFEHFSELTNYDNQFIVRPNNDTLCSG